MAILKNKKKKQAKSQAEELASVYNIQYGPEGKTFTIHAKDDPTGAKGRTSKLVEAGRFFPNLSRKKRLTTRYFQEMAEAQNLDNIKKNQATRDSEIADLKNELDKQKKINKEISNAVNDLYSKTDDKKKGKTVKGKLTDKGKGKRKKVTDSKIIDNKAIEDKNVKDNTDSKTKVTDYSSGISYDLDPWTKFIETEYNRPTKESNFNKYLEAVFGKKNMTPGYSEKVTNPAKDWITINKGGNPYMIVDYDKQFSSKEIPGKAYPEFKTPYTQQALGKSKKKVNVRGIPTFSSQAEALKEFTSREAVPEDIKQSLIEYSKKRIEGLPELEFLSKVKIEPTKLKSVPFRMFRIQGIAGMFQIAQDGTISKVQ
jgi:hypothetical protein